MIYWALRKIIFGIEGMISFLFSIFSSFNSFWVLSFVIFLWEFVRASAIQELSLLILFVVKLGVFCIIELENVGLTYAKTIYYLNNTKD